MAPRMPYDVSVMANDCANRTNIIRWLESVANTPKNFTQSQSEYEEIVSASKQRIWRLRYNCQRV